MCSNYILKCIILFFRLLFYNLKDFLWYFILKAAQSVIVIMIFCFLVLFRFLFILFTEQLFSNRLLLCGKEKTILSSNRSILVSPQLTEPCHSNKSSRLMGALLEWSNGLSVLGPFMTVFEWMMWLLTQIHFNLWKAGFCFYSSTPSPSFDYTVSSNYTSFCTSW